jgi:hypothetical protein
VTASIPTRLLFLSSLMSLKNILNHEPLPLHPYPRVSLGDQSIHDDSRLSPLPSPPSHTHSAEPLSSTTHHRSYENIGWDSRSRDWNVDDHTTEPRYDEDHLLSPIEPQPIYTQPTDNDVLSRKRRKGDLDAEYMPAKPRRVPHTFVIMSFPSDSCITRLVNARLPGKGRRRVPCHPPAN